MAAQDIKTVFFLVAHTFKKRRLRSFPSKWVRTLTITIPDFISYSLSLSTFSKVFLCSSSFKNIAYYLLYPNNAIGIELAILTLFGIIQYIRLFLGTKGNKSESATNMLWFLILSLAVGFGQFFFLLLQTYVYHSFFVGLAATAPKI